MTDDTTREGRDIGRSMLPDQSIPEELPALVHLGVSFMHRRFRTSGPTDDLGYAAIALVNRLRLAGPQSVAALRDWEGVTEAIISQSAARLIEGGYVERAEDDARGQVMLRATERGRVASERWFAGAVGWVESRLEKLSDDDRETVRRASLLFIEAARD